MLNRVLFQVKRAAFIMFSHNKDEIIIVAGEPRSGTTYLAEILSQLFDGLIIFEPLHKLRGIKPFGFDLGWRPRMDPLETNIPLRKYLHRILTKPKNTSFTLSQARLKSIIFHKCRIYKFVRANGLLLWIIERFSFTIKPFVIIRNPITTCISQLNSFGSEDYIKHDKKQVNSFLNKNTFPLRYLTILECRLVLYLIENQDHNIIDNKDSFNLIFYENLVSDLSNAIVKCTKSCGFEISLNAINLRKKSSTTVYSNSYCHGLKYSKLSQKEKSRIQQIFFYFNYSVYSTTQLKPIV